MNENMRALAPAVVERLRSVGTATLTFQLQKRGIRSTFLGGLRPMHANQSMVGRARTLRYVALREDLQPHYGPGMNAQKRLIESTRPGDVLVMEARGIQDAATIGDILASRAFALGAAGIVTDGAVRDTPAVAALGQPVYHQGSHGATLGRCHMPFSLDEPITCAGVFVVPGDVIVGDGEGAVVIPSALVEEVAQDAAEQEEREAFAFERVTAGESIEGLMPLSESREAEFQAWREARNSS